MQKFAGCQAEIRNIHINVFLYFVFYICTCSSLKSINSIFKPVLGLTIASCSNLGVEGSNIEQNASFFKQQILLTHWNTCERIIPLETNIRLSVKTCRTH